MSNALLDPQETARRIAEGRYLLLAGDERLLAGLPGGNWIGGTIPYFMTDAGGCFCEDKIFMTEIPFALHASVRLYSESELPSIYQDMGDNNVTFVIIPADSSAHTEFALHAPRYKNFADKPLLGWIAGVNLDDLGKVRPRVFCGGPKSLGDSAAAMRLRLPSDRLAQIGIINLFKPGTGDVISFATGGFSVTTARINGQEENLADYLSRPGTDTRLPLVANYCGAMVNVGIKNVDQEKHVVDFFGPVVPGIDYKLAAPIGDYVSAFESKLKQLEADDIVFSCNCISNYLYSQLEGRRTGNIVGPVTFGEIAYQLLNQTLVYLSLVKPL